MAAASHQGMFASAQASRQTAAELSFKGAQANMAFIRIGRHFPITRQDQLAWTTIDYMHWCRHGNPVINDRRTARPPRASSATWPTTRCATTSRSPPGELLAQPRVKP